MALPNIQYANTSDCTSIAYHAMGKRQCALSRRFILRLDVQLGGSHRRVKNGEERGGCAPVI